MGACEFVSSGKGKSAKEAFSNVVSNARYENGHGGYTGTIAEKSAFKMVSGVTAKTVREAADLAEKLLNEDDATYGDKWGPCHCIHVEGTDTYVFFGWASS